MRYLTLSADGLNTVQLCGRKYLYSKVMRLVPIGEKAAQLEKGDLMHRVLEAHYSSLLEVQEGKSQLSLSSIIEHAVDKGRRYSVDMDLPVPEQEEVIKQYKFYAVHYKDDPWKPLAVEQKFNKLVYVRDDQFVDDCLGCIEASKLETKDVSCDQHEGLTVILEGRIDLVAQHLVSKDIYLWDHKTGQRRANPTKLNNQFIAYAFGVNLHHVVLNQIGFQKTVPIPQRFHRTMMAYSEALIQEWRDNAIFWAEQINQFEKQGHFPFNWTSCDKFSGCIFREVCESHPGARQAKMIANFMVRPHTLFPELTPEASVETEVPE